MTKKEKKLEYFKKVEKLFTEFSRIMIVGVDNVSSSLMQKCRLALRGKAVILMGKNSLIRRGMQNVKNIPGLSSLQDRLKGNVFIYDFILFFDCLCYDIYQVGIVFTNLELSEIRDIITLNKISGPAKPGQIAPCDVVVPKGNTGLDPQQTTFLQALNIATKITKGAIEILNDVQVCSFYCYCVFYY
jgi:large subunit ribosomal protein LP0